MHFLTLLLFLLVIACEEQTVVKPLNEQVELVQEDSLFTLKLSFVGDIMGHGDQIRSAAGSPENLKSRNMADFDYSSCFRYVAPIFKSADLMIGNLEMTLSNKGKYAGYPMFKSPDKFAYQLKADGFDLLTTCNNHSNDGFLYGIQHTIEVLDSLEILHTGTFRNYQEKKASYPLCVTKKIGEAEFRIVFLNYTYGTNGINTPAPALVNLIDRDSILKDIRDAKEMQPDIIIAITHWGHEYHLDESSHQKRICDLLWANGVDIVVGAHPHVIQPIKTKTVYNADSTISREKLVAFSLGNFISNQFRSNTDIGLILEIELEKNINSGAVRLKHHDYILAWRYIFGRYDREKSVYDRKYAVIPVSAFEQDSLNVLKMERQQIRAMKNATAAMRKHLSRFQGVERKVKFEELGNIKALE